MFQTALRFIAGAAVALAIWWYATPVYNGWLCAAAQVMLLYDHRIAGASIETRDHAVAVRSGTDAPSIRVPADELTYNFVLFGGLMFAAPPRKLWRGLVAFLVLLAFHAVALVLTIESTYATRAGAWSTAHYSSLAQDFWQAMEYIYRLGGMFAVAFVCWYAATWSDARGSQPETAKKSGRG